MGQLLSVPLIIVLLGIAIAAITDVRHFKIYNALTIPMLITGLAFHFMNDGWSGIILSSCGVLLGFGALIVPYLLGAMGAGDVKLLAAIGAWLGVAPTVLILVVSLLATALYSFLLLLWKGRIRETWINLQIVTYRLLTIARHLLAVEKHQAVELIAAAPAERYRLIPFSVMVFIGTALIVFGYYFKP